MIFSSAKYVILTLERLNNLPNTVHKLGFGLLTILVAVAVPVVLSSFYRKEKREFGILDHYVILSRVFKFKRWPIFIALIFLPTLFWEFSSGLARLFEIILSIVGIWWVFFRFVDAYRWFRGGDFEVSKFRFSCLGSLRKGTDIWTAWCSVWQTENISRESEERFFVKFSCVIDRLLGKVKNLKTIAKLLLDFYQSINNRSIITLVVYEDVFPKVLKWYFEVWKKAYEYINQEKQLDRWGDYNEISEILDSIIRKFEERALKEGHAFSFFQYFVKHAENHKTEFVLYKNEERYYRKSLLSIFYPVFFEKVSNSPERHAIWEDYLPLGWKITRSNWKDSEKVFSKISWDEFISCLGERIWRPETDFDQELDDISINLFPEVESSIWAMFLIFALSPYGKERMGAVIHRPWNFGLVGRVRSYFGPAGESEEDFDRRLMQMVHAQYELEKKNTLELATLLLPKVFSKENMEESIKNLEALEYEKESKEEKKRLRLIGVFTEMLEFLNEQQDNPKNNPKVSNSCK